MAINTNCCSKICTVEFWTLIYGIIISVITGAGCLIAIGSIIYLITMADHFSQNDLIMHLSVLGIYNGPCFIILPFTLTLVIGICKKNHKAVLVYFIYGTIQTAIYVLGSIALMICLTGTMFPIMFIIFTVIGFSSQYGAWMTYKKLLNKHLAVRTAYQDEERLLRNAHSNNAYFILRKT